MYRSPDEMLGNGGAESAAGQSLPVSEALSIKANFCADLLLEAHHLSALAWPESQVDERIARASDLLDDMDGVLVTLDRLRDSGDFGTVAALHRQFEFVRAAMADRRRATLARWQSDPER